MFNYTDHVRRLMEDIVSRVPALSAIDVRDVLVFARLGRTSTHGAYATCHSLMLPDSEPAYYFWRDRRTGRLTRRSEWFVTRSPYVRVDGRRVTHLISLSLPRFCDQTLKGSAKQDTYPQGLDWHAKLDTIVHELYHVDPHGGGIRASTRSDGRPSAQTHTAQFFRDVSRMVREYLDSRPDPAISEFLALSFDEFTRLHGAVVATTFRAFPSFPQRFRERMIEQPRMPRVAHVVMLDGRQHQRLYTDVHLETRQFLARSTRRTATSQHAGTIKGVHPRQPSSLAAHRQPR
ncbi:MAG: hypothetical protein NT151_07780 [Acidobacteria bacterium]|nr:hypothetical protein [Acidobacteriota bacterium]